MLITALTKVVRRDVRELRELVVGAMQLRPHRQDVE
jgi:hypothetical protein